MEQFLRETRKYLDKETYKDSKIHVVIGNEACDLDSAVSALTYSYFLHKASSSSQPLCLPVLNTQKSKFHLKTDTKFLLSHTGINPDYLTFRDDLDLHDLHQQGRLILTLVDHNVLVGHDSSLEDSVVMVIDHRPLERKPCDRVKIIQDLVGSCSSLVARILLDSPEFTICPQVATLLLGTILVNTVNTSPEAGKTTPYDQEILCRLTQIVPDLDKDKLYSDIQQAKNDISALNTKEVLEKDLKCVTHGNHTVVMSSIPVSLEVFLQRSDVSESMNSVMLDRKGQSVVVMTMHVDTGVPRREILIFSNSVEETTKLAEFLKTNEEIQLDFQLFTCEFKNCLAYYQGNVKASRKKVLPLVKSFLQTTNVPQDDLLLNFDPFGTVESVGQSNTLLDFSNNSASPSVVMSSGPCSTNQDLLFDPLTTDSSNNQTASQDLLGLFEDTVQRKHPKISITLPKSPVEPSSSAGVPDLLGDFTEADVMESPLRTPDLMQSLSEASSGPGSAWNSRPGSEYPSHTVTPPETATPPNSLISTGFHANNEFTLPSMNNAETIEKIQQKKRQMMKGTKKMKDVMDSYPFTPQNSVADVQFDSLAKEHNLRTLNNSQMVRQVEQKRKSLGGEVDLLSSADQEEENVPFTPQNSFVSEQFSEFYDHESDLPSLNSAEMVQRIQEKRASMGGGIMEEEKAAEEDDSVPFTPQNSFMESNFDTLANEHILPSLNNADMVQQVKQKRSTLGSRLADPDVNSSMSPGGVEGSDPSQIYSPFTPKNSFVESNMEKYQSQGLDLNSLNSRLLDISQDKSVIFSQESSFLDFDPVSIEPENVVAKGIAQEMLKDSQEASGSQLLDLDFNDDNNGDSPAGNHGKSNGTMGKDFSQRSQQEGNQSSDSEPGKGDNPIQDVAFSLAGELIEHVLDNFEPNQSLIDNTPVSPSTAEIPEVIEVKPEKQDAVNSVWQGLTAESLDNGVKKVASNSQLLSLETDYLSKVDPLHGTYDLVTHEADREVVESSSFRKISGEAPKTVREEILKESSHVPEREEAGINGIMEEGGSDRKTKELEDDRKNEEGMNKEEEMEKTDQEIPSPTQRMAESLLNSVFQNAVKVVQSESKEASNEQKTTISQQSIFNFDTTEDSMEESGSSPSDTSSPTQSTTTEASYHLSSPECEAAGEGRGEGESMPRADKSVLSVTSISSESLSSYTGIKSDVNLLERTEKSLMSFGSISNESLLSYSGVKSDMNLEALGGPTSPKSKNFTKNRPPVTENLDKSDNLATETSKVIFKLDSFDDNLEEAIEETKVQEKEKVDSGSRREVYETSAGRISIRVDDEAVLSESSPSNDQTPLTSVGEEKTPKTSSSDDGLPLVSVSSDPFESLTSSAIVTKDEEKALDENNKNSSDDMTDQDNKIKDRLGGLDLADEWQEDDIPGMPPAEKVSDSSDSEGSRSRHSSNSSNSSNEHSPVRPSLLSAHPKKKITANFNILSDDLDDDGMDPADGLEWENDTPIKRTDPLPEFSARDEYRESKLWKGVEIGGKQMKIDLKVIEPYKRVLSHGGYYGEGLNAIIIFSGCYLPDHSRRDYQYVMDNLFMYVISTLETLVAEDYMIVYFHGATPRRQMPSFGWLKKCYQMIDRRLRKNLKSLLLIHPTLWLRTIVMMTRPFISAKFSSKLWFVRSLSELGQNIPMEYISVPEQVQH
ncbi:uncharacterized protein LOC133189157 isoform X2 [Saccostrea echinata]|uniref:uncharacterized protein LOC133189157 isoform X2 n=1 Tax=Saccostrea echinata TaxID=191078 RepID=UPI002A80F5D6|nr:uncharacterized protein LOC133189157 isoform X2 [Saccostrea echinata]